MKRLLPRLALIVLLATAVLQPALVRAGPAPVSSRADSGPGTLRQALLDAIPGDHITFNTTVFPPGNPSTIFLLSTLRLTKDSITIDASAAGVILDGSQAPADTDGLTVAANNCVIQGLKIQHFKYGVAAGNGIYITHGAAGNLIGGSRTTGNGPNGQGNLIINNGGNGIAISGPNTHDNIIRGNSIGVDASASWDRGNTRNGIAIYAGASKTHIGSASPNERNVIGGNQQNGVWIAGVGSIQNDVVGNYIGTNFNGLTKVPNQLSGVALHAAAQSNCIGGTTDLAQSKCIAAAGNIISGNTASGVDIRDANTNFNVVQGNLIGLNLLGTAGIGNGLDGITMILGASGNQIGDGTVAGRNIISANAFNGVRVGDQLKDRFTANSPTQNNTIQGNYIGSNRTGTAALGNGLHGVEITEGAHHNRVGGDQPGQGNLLSGNFNHGLVIRYGAHHNIAWGNLIGPDATGTVSLGNQPFGGIDIAEGAHENVIGGLQSGQGNLISGNRTDGIALFDNTGKGSFGNQVLGNRIGLSLAGDNPLPNLGFGISAVSGASGTRIEGNRIGYNQAYGIWVAPCDQFNSGNTITMNSVYSNTLGGILTSCSVPPPTIRVTSSGASESVTGKTLPNTTVEVFSDDGGQGRLYEGTAHANQTGEYLFVAPAGRFNGPNVTATMTDSNGNTSSFAQPGHLLWTMLLYLNGDNDLSKAMFDLVKRIVAAGPSPRANVLALMDGRSGSNAGSVLYDLSNGQATVLNVPLVTKDGELNMGNGQTLIDFVSWARTNYPTRHTLLSIIDHGGGWAPSSKDYIPGATPHHRSWLAGGNGLSWDFNPGKSNPDNDYDYLDSPEIHQALAIITGNGAKKLDVVFYDVCLMGMIEVAYQIKDYADFFVSSQNIGWAPDGPQNRYVRAIQSITSATTPRAMGKLLVNAYADSLPPQGHPYTISAIDMSQLPGIVEATHQLALAVSQRVTGDARASLLKTAYDNSQKIDYDSDFQIEPTKDGFVDLYDFALRVSAQFGDPVITKHANDIISALTTAVVAEHHRSGSPWKFPNRPWNLDNVHGLSIFLPLGEDLILPVASNLASVAPAQTIDLPLRQTYTTTQLLFVGATEWRTLIEKYYRIVPVPTATTSGPLDGLQSPDLTAPTTVITVSPTIASIRLNQPITIKWSSSDPQLNLDGTSGGSGVGGATLWYWPPGGQWNPFVTQGGTSGEFHITFTTLGCHSLSVRAIDNAGNVEPLASGRNLFFGVLPIGACASVVYLPIIRR